MNVNAIEAAPSHGAAEVVQVDPLAKWPVIGSVAELREYLRGDPAVSHGWGSPGFQALATYRLGVWSRGLNNPVLRKPVRLVCRILRRRMQNVYGIELDDRTHIGRRFLIAHQHGIVIHNLAIIGDDCVVRQGVTIGAVGKRAGAPRLGNRVRVGAGAVLVGPIRVGDDVLIAPNAVVMTNVPAGAIVSSPQSRIVSPPPRRGSPTA